ncbi:MAG: prolyl oligopeptidase family serine peptidase [Gammaproteobacteria bacterium]|nr:prolyl oligopeptidase family serine peptidase [Gammaproteobacteria bacterium]
MIKPSKITMPVLTALVAMTASGVLAQIDSNHSVDPTWMWTSEPVSEKAITVIEAVPGSDIPVHLMFVELKDGVYAPIGLRKPEGTGPFPTIVFAHMNGGLGLRWIREWTQNGSWTLEQFLAAGYAVVWMRYRAEVESSYGSPLIEGEWQGRQIFSRGPFEYEDAISIIEYIKTLPFVDSARLGYLGVSHGGEMLMKIATEYNGLRAGIANEPASIEYLARRSREPSDIQTEPGAETHEHYSPQLELKRTLEMRRRLNLETATKRIDAINMPILVQGRHRDHNQAIFRLSYELLKEAGKDVEWKSYDHDEHAFIIVKRNADGAYDPDLMQLEAVRDSIAYFDRHMKMAAEE